MQSTIVVADTSVLPIEGAIPGARKVGLSVNCSARAGQTDSM
jgi:hypothetical protein